MSTLAELRAKVNKAQEQSRTNNFDSNSIFSFKNLKAGDKIRIRFVPDGEPNDFFWRPLNTRSLQFNSIRLNTGEIVQNRTYVSVPAFNIQKNEVNLNGLPDEYLYYSNDDVIQQKIKGFWNGTDEGRKLYGKFGKNQRYVFQGFVRAEGYETKLYRFIINKELFGIIYSFMTDDEINDIPSDIENGREFILNVSEKLVPINGNTQKIKDYTSSKWSNNISPLTAEERAWLAENKPFVLKNYIPSRPSTEQEIAMLELFEASYNEEPYDYNRWFNIFKPDNVFFDENGQIKDLKANNPTTTATEIPQQAQVTYTTVPPQYGSMPAQQQTHNPIRQGEQAFMNQFAESVKAPYPMGVDPRVYQNTGMDNIVVAPNTNPQQYVYAAQPQLSTAQPVAQPVAQTVSNPTAPQLIKENTVQVNGDNPTAVISDILSKFKIPQQG